MILTPSARKKPETEGIFISEGFPSPKKECLALEQTRLLTEVMHLREHMLPDGTVPDEVLYDVRTNLFTAAQEIAMPSAVTTTMQKVEHHEDESGRKQRVVKWLGRTAVEVAESGYDFHFSKPAFERVDVEVAEARYSQEHLRAGTMQVFVSPKMSNKDADAQTAKAEHLYDADSIRTATAVTDNRGQIVARRMQSLLVSDIPLEAWAAMFEDPDNIFGRAIELQDRDSALSVMELFSHLDLPEEMLPEGPVSIVAAVLPYVADIASRRKVAEQLDKFRGDQELYQRHAEQTAAEWLEFEIELARSLKSGAATYEVQRMIAGLQHQWGKDDLDVINKHFVDGNYMMTIELASMLEGTKQNLLGGKAAVLVKNEKVWAQMGQEKAEQMYYDISFAEQLRVEGSTDYYRIEAENQRNIARANLKVGGGCAGDRQGRFRNGDGTGGEGANGSEGNSTEGEVWTWKKGVCRVDACKSPQPTEVGPCSVCRNCQHMFDKGIDPTESVARREPKQKTEAVLSEWLAKVIKKPEKLPEKKQLHQEEFILAA